MLPIIFVDIDAELKLVKNVALFMVDLGSHGALAAGQAVLVQHKKTVDALSVADNISNSPKEPTQVGLNALNHQLMQEMLNWQSYDPSLDGMLWDFPAR
jgi:hypothetical protein